MSPLPTVSTFPPIVGRTVSLEPGGGLCGGRVTLEDFFPAALDIQRTRPTRNPFLSTFTLPLLAAEMSKFPR